MSSLTKIENEQLIQKWVVAERQLKKLNEQTRELREIKNELSAKLTQYIETQHLSDIETSEGKIRMIEKKEYTPLTYGYLEKSLKKIISDPDKLQQIIQHVKNDREIKIGKELSFK